MRRRHGVRPATGAPDATRCASSRRRWPSASATRGTWHASFQRRTYLFKIDGLAVNAIGASKSETIGYVYNLKSVGDFAGTYTAIEAGGAVGGGRASPA